MRLIQIEFNRIGLIYELFEPSNMKILFQCSKLLKVLEKKKKKSIIVKYILPSILSFKMSAGL